MSEKGHYFLCDFLIIPANVLSFRFWQEMKKNSGCYKEYRFKASALHSDDKNKTKQFYLSKKEKKTTTTAVGGYSGDPVWMQPCGFPDINVMLTGCYATSGPAGNHIYNSSDLVETDKIYTWWILQGSTYTAGNTCPLITQVRHEHRGFICTRGLW